MGFVDEAVSDAFLARLRATLEVSEGEPEVSLPPLITRRLSDIDRRLEALMEALAPDTEQLQRTQATYEALVVERSFAWIGKQRRLSKDFEQLPLVSEAWVYLSMIQHMLRRLTS